MDTERWNRIEELFLRAADLDAAARRELLEGRRAEEPEVVAHVERLLRREDEGSDAFLESLERGTWWRREDPMLGRELGAYRLVARIAAGGMGVVYRAQRTDGLFDHDVAVKLIRAESASESAVRRFELERRALAALSHPNIARLHDGGTTDEGSPYLVMELIRGAPIDAYCDEHRLAVTDRLRLFATVCRAVHFAHQNLLVHRDLKPSNILVDEHGTPKLLDFGIAKLLDEEPGERGATRTIARVLTPEYASPEQLAGGAVTTAIDVYSLGVVLYELLAGAKPFERHSRSPVEWHKVVTERTPERPSDALGRSAGEDGDARPGPEEVATLRGTTAAGLRRRLRGDLDRIVLMTLRKEPERRYASAQALAEDVERHLSGNPVLAREDSFLYRTTKFVQRHRIQVSAAALVVVAIAVALVVTRRSELRARADAEHARIEAESLEQAVEFVLDTFLAAGVALTDEQLAAARRRVLSHADRVRLQHAERPHLRANLLDTLGRVSLRLDAYDEAEQLVGEARAVREEAFGAKSLEAALSLRSLGHVCLERGQVVEAREHLESALALHRTLAPGTHTDVATAANDLAVCLRRLGDLDGAERLHREALALRRAHGGRELPVAESLNNLAGVHLDRGETEEARELLAEALAIRERLLSPSHPLTLQSTSNLAIPTWRLGERDAAIALLTEAAQEARSLGADGAESLAKTLMNLASMHIAAGEPEKAGELLAEALAIEERRLEPDHPSLAGLHSRLAALAHARGDEAGARASWERAVELRRAPSASPLSLAAALYGYGRFLIEVGDTQAALGVLTESVQLLDADPPVEPLALGRAELALGECLVALERPADARGHLRAAAQRLEAYPMAQAERERALRALEAAGGEE